jgi:hypothetical protein
MPLLQEFHTRRSLFTYRPGQGRQEARLQRLLQERRTFVAAAKVRCDEQDLRLSRTAAADGVLAPLIGTRLRRSL